MYAIYTKDKTEYVPTRMNSELLTGIENYMKANGMETYERARSKAIRELIELGLSAWSSNLQNTTQISREHIIETEVIERTEKITRQKIVNLEHIRAFFPKNLAELLTFECNERDAIIRKKSWLNRKQWRKATNIVKKHDGEWIPDGNESRWIMPLT
jgi:hypothetical protein